MKQILILSVLIISTFGAKLNQYLPPRPENHNAQFQPPALPTGNLPEQPFEPPQFDQTNQQRYTPKASEQSGQPSSPFAQKNVPSGSNYGVPEQSGQSSSPFGQFSQKTSPNGYGNGNTQQTRPFEQPAQKKSFNGNIYGTPEQYGQSSSPFGQVSQKNTFNTNPSRQYLTPNNKDTSGQSSNSFGQFQSPTTGYSQGKTADTFNTNPSRQYLTPNNKDTSGQSSNSFGQFQSPTTGYSQGKTADTFNTNPSRQYLTPNNKDTSGQSSNSFGQFQSPTTGYSQGKTAGFGPKSQEQFPNQGPTYNGQSINDYNQQNKFPGAQSNFGPQSAPIGLIRSEINPDAGDGHYNYLYETENGITVQEEGLEKTEGKSAQGGFSYTSPEGEQISIEYTADANGFIPKGSHVPEIPEAIAKSIELNKAAEARGEYNEGSYREDYNDEPTGYQGNAPTGQSSFNSYQAPQTINNGYENSGAARTNNFADQGTFASQDNKQVAPFGQANNAPGSQTPFGQQNNGAKSSFGQNNGYQYSAPGKTNFADQGTFASQPSKQVTPFGQQNNGPKTSFGQNNNGYQYSAPGKTNFADQGTFASQPSKQVTPFGQQNDGPKTSFGQNNNGYQYSAPGTTNFADQGTFASQPSKQITPFGQQNNVPSTVFGQQNNGPFGQQNNGGKSASNNGYQYPTPEQSSFATQQIKKVAPFGSQESKYAPKQQYEAPGQASTNNNNNGKFTFQKNVPEVPSGQFGTVQDNQGGYKY